MTDNALIASLDQHVEPGTYVKIQAASSRYSGLYGWTGEVWYHGNRWFVAVHDRCDLSGYYQWFALDEIWLASISDILSDEEIAERRRRVDRARKAYKRAKAQV